MVQATLHSFFAPVRAVSSEDRTSIADTEARDVQPLRTESAACQAAEPATCNRFLRSLFGLSAGVWSARRARADMLRHGWNGIHQVAAYDTADAATGEDRVAITSIRLCPATQRVAFTQASGILNLYPAHDLIQDARQLGRRTRETRTAAPSAGQAGQAAVLWDDTTQLPTSPDNSNPSSPVTSPRRNQRTVGTSTSLQRHMSVRLRRHAAALQRSVQATTVNHDNLPSCGLRLLMGHKLTDMAWCPRKPGMLALTGATGPQVTLIELEAGTRRSWPLVTRTQRGAGHAAAFTHVAFTPQGPYSLCASAQHASSVHLWDIRSSKVAAAELQCPSGAHLSTGPQCGHDGHLVYAATSHSTLLVWDLRKGSSSSGVLNFGGTGLYSHPLLCEHMLGCQLQRAWSMQTGQATAVTAGAPVMSARALPTDLRTGTGLVQPTAQSRWRPAVDSIVLCPRDHRQLAVIMQDCTAAVIQLPDCTVTHMWPCTSLGETCVAAVHGHSRFVMQQKSGCWTSQGDRLLLPHMLRIPAPDSDPPPGVSDTTAVAVGAATEPAVHHPALALMDCRSGSHSCDSLSWPKKQRTAAETHFSENSHAWEIQHTVNGERVCDSMLGRESVRMRQQSLSAHRVPWGSAPQRTGLNSESEVLAGLVQGASGWEGSEVGQGERVMPVSGWVTRVVDAGGVTGGWPCVLAGTLGGQLLVVGSG